jgi:tetratricopeptide (TPR) repeat protein
MNDPALIASSLLLIVIGEIVLWTRRHEAGLSRWKFRALLYGIGLVLVPVLMTQPAFFARFTTFLTGFYALLFVLLVALYVYASRQFQGVNRVLAQAQQLHQFGKTSEAIAVLKNHRRDAARIDKNTESLLLTEIARLALELGNEEDAGRWLDEAQALSEWNQAVYAIRADLLARAGQHDAACDRIQQGLAKLPKSAWLHTELAKQLADAGRIDEARTTLALTIELLDNEKHLDVFDPADWKEKRIAPLVNQLDQCERTV